MEILDQAFEAAKTFQPLNAEQMATLLAKTKDAAMHGKYESFKTSDAYDGAGRHPEWMG